MYRVTFHLGLCSKIILQCQYVSTRVRLVTSEVASSCILDSVLYSFLYTYYRGNNHTSYVVPQDIQCHLLESTKKQ